MLDILKSHLDKRDLMVHSSIKSIGEPIDLQVLISFLADSIGPDSNLIMPTFNFSFKESRIFNPATTPTTNGALPEFFRTAKIHGKAVQRNLNPMQSIAVCGKDADQYCQMNCPSTFGKGSAFEKLFFRNAQIMLLGVDYNKISLYHLPEEQLQVPYRFWKNFEGEIHQQNEIRKISFPMYARKLEFMPNINHYGLLLEEKGKVKKFHFHNAVVRLLDSKDLVELLMEEIKRDPYALTKTSRDTFALITQK